MGRPAGSPNITNQKAIIEICEKCNLPPKTCNKRCRRFENEYKRIMEEARNANKQQRNPI